jgi:hypothetical protein
MNLIEAGQLLANPKSTRQGFPYSFNNIQPSESSAIFSPNFQVRPLREITSASGQQSLTYATGAD